MRPVARIRSGSSRKFDGAINRSSARTPTNNNDRQCTTILEPLGLGRLQRVVNYTLLIVPGHAQNAPLEPEYPSFPTSDRP